MLQFKFRIAPVRVERVTLNVRKKVKYALLGIFGIGGVLSARLVGFCGVAACIRVYQVSGLHLLRFKQLLMRFKVLRDEKLRRNVLGRLVRLQQGQLYRGMRHRYSLPVRGQRTRSNARTIRRMAGKYRRHSRLQFFFVRKRSSRYRKQLGKGKRSNFKKRKNV